MNSSSHRRHHRFDFDDLSCVVADRGRFFALFVKDRLFHRDEVIIVRISRARFNQLIRRGAKRCRVV